MCTDAASIARLADEAPGLLSRALRTGGCFADLFCERTVHHRLSLRQAQASGAAGRARQRADRRTVEGAALRVLGGGREGFAHTSGPALHALVEAADEAAARLGRAGPTRRAVPTASCPAPPDLPADAPDAVAAGEKGALLRLAADAALSLDDRVRGVAVDYQDRVRRTVVVTSEGVLRAEATMLLGLRVAVTLTTAAGEVNTHAMAGGAYGFGHFFAHTPEQVARDAVERARRLAAAVPVAPGVMPVVLAGGWGGVWLHEAVGHLLEADTVASGASPFAGRVGRAVATPAVTLVDDATLPGGRGGFTFDDEGTPAGRTVLIEDGVLRGFLTDRRHAGAMGLPLTGNARRQDYRHAPLPRMTNLLLPGGDAAAADLLAGVADGLYVRMVGHGVMRPGQGFAFDVLEGYRIEQGQRGAPVAGARIAGMGPASLGVVDAVGCDVQVDTARGQCEKAGQIVPVSVGMPTVLIRAMQVERIEH